MRTSFATTDFAKLLMEPALRPDGAVFVARATGVSSVYETHSKAWMKDPNCPISPRVTSATLKTLRAVFCHTVMY